MAHRYDVYRYGRFIEHEYKYAGKYGAKGEKRAPRKKATPEQIKKQNQWNKEKLVLRKMRANFETGDLWITLKLPKGTKKTAKQILKIRDKFFRQLRTAYKKQGEVLKYMYRIEIGERGGIHIHVLINGIRGSSALVRDIWKKNIGGNVNYEPLYEEGGFKNLADYLVKPIKEEITGQLTLFGSEEEVKIFCKYGCSRNLTVPEPESHEYKKRTVRGLIENGPEPTPGYYIDRDSIRQGINPYTGMSYYYYTEIKLGEQIEDIWKEDDSG